MEIGRLGTSFIGDSVISAVAASIETGFVFPEKGSQIAKALCEISDKKKYDSIESASEFCDRINRDLQLLGGDKHLSLMFSPVPIPLRDFPSKPMPDELKRHREIYRRHNFGFEKVEILPGNVGYVALRYFSPPEWGAETAVSAFNFLANTDALIIDLRNTGGGSPAMIALILTFLFAPETSIHINSIYPRDASVPTQFWTLPFVPGKRLANQMVCVLTSTTTFSAAEEFAYDLKMLRRATIIGETTKGGAHPSVLHRIHDHFFLSIPGGRAVNPISQSNWEGNGVQPDIPSPASKALDLAVTVCLKSILNGCTDSDAIEEISKILEQFSVHA